MSVLEQINSPWRMRFFMWWKLPAAAFMGLSIASCSAKQAVVRLPYRWRSQNPFRSTYFAAQCAAAEMSTGLLALVALDGKEPVSMLIVGIEAEFLKKVAGTLLFTCNAGQEIADAVQRAVDSGEPKMLRVLSVGMLPDGTEAARIWVTWSFKKRGNTP
ncbi:MAG: DUF4442 domain-containing protein [Saprospiraceae bacterium]